ncbi:hypothetical protein CAAN3_21S00672 [[Candida] anglica]
MDPNKNYDAMNVQMLYSDITTLINSNPDIILPKVESTFVNPRICPVCGKSPNEMSRHMKIHDTCPRFTCKFPSGWCHYKYVNYKRKYEFKRHLLARHFKFDDIKMNSKMTVSTVLDHAGMCPCGIRSTARWWIDNHILVEDQSQKCTFFRY